ncbi:MAG TPA: glycoside hydrolase family 30 beta sandwich domain-containing protein [Polyangiaceae bacterium]|nr:glycoside hydrolase family 30 beta sandwich domain-containing protein [Polyangiaceae bacterium]
MTQRGRLSILASGTAVCLFALGTGCEGGSNSTASGGTTGGVASTSSQGGADLGQGGYQVGVGGNPSGQGGALPNQAGSSAISAGGVQLTMNTAEAGSTGALGGAGAAAGTAATTQPAPTVTVSLNPAETYQTLEGFGAAIAWYLSTVSGHTKGAELYQVLFGDLGLDILRMRNAFGRSEFTDAVREKKILEAATASIGRRPKVLMSSWSPPAALKANGLETCTGEATCTLKKTDGAYVYTEFANYWFDAVNAYRNVGLVPDWISIQNEPDFIPTGYEGCKFRATETAEFPGYGQALAAVATKLNTMSDPPKLIGPELIGIHWQKMPTYMSALDKSLLWAAAHHLYERGTDGICDWRTPGPDSYLAPMLEAKSAVGTLPVFQTEFATDDDNGTEGGFEVAWLIHNSLVEEGVSAWLYWDLVWGAGRGLVSVPDANSYSIRDQYYSVRHYARYTDPGDVRIGATASSAAVRVSAFRSPDQKRITLIVLNTGTSEERISVAFGGFTAASSLVIRTVYVPGSSVRWETQAPIAQGGVVVLPSRSVATVVLNG